MEEAIHDSETPTSSVLPQINAAFSAKVNLAAFQNAVPVLRELSIFNLTDELLRDLDLRINSVPPFFKPRVWHLDEIAPGAKYNLRDLDLELDGALLNRLTESETASVAIVLEKRDLGREVARLEINVEILPRNQWGGVSDFPEMLAAFVQPNEPAVEKILKDAAQILRANGKDSALTGYKSGPKQVWEIASSIWTAVVGMGIDYALPPASFEFAGQKVRGPTQVAESGLATCLDLSVLFCSVMEQAGLNPLLVIVKEHAFAGVWLGPDEFATVIGDDVTALRKRIRLQELVLFETTVATHQPPPSFSYAIQLGARHVSEENQENFEMVVDISRARLQRIKPLASTTAAISEPAVAQVLPCAPMFESAPDMLDIRPNVAVDPVSLNPNDRLAHWQRKLLDLSLRNNLLNFRGGKKSLKLEAPDPGLLEDRLSDGQALKVLAVPDFMNGSDPRERTIHEGRAREDVRREHGLDALERREVFVDLSEEELEPRLVDLYRAARSTIQEGGANTLFLAMGFLNWTRDDKMNQSYRAPLVLVPVTLSRKSARAGFTLTIHDDEPRFNPTLVEMLRQDFRLNLGIADGDLPKDAAGLDLPGIWNAVSQSVKELKGWEVSEDVVLAMFSFSKYLMWKDLVERTEQLRENPVVRHLIDTPRDPFPSSVEFPHTQRLDSEFTPAQVFCPLPADSSQISAVMAASRGKDFVLIGPPGTGKSQTIANLIAQCLAEGKRVLFVSEKLAALDVVYRRLQAVELGDFCLELHSNKAKKVEVLAQLQKSWDAQGSLDPDAWETEARRLRIIRDQLNLYVTRLHFRHSNGMTIYEAIGRVVKGADVPQLGLSWPSPTTHGPGQVAAMREIVDRLEVNVKAIGPTPVRDNPLIYVGHSDWSPLWQQSFVVGAQAVLNLIDPLQQRLSQLCVAIGLGSMCPDRGGRQALCELAQCFPQAVGQDWRFVLRPDSRRIVERLREGQNLLRKHSDITAALSTPWPDAVLKACHEGLKLLKERRVALARLGPPWSDNVLANVKKGLGLLDKIDATTKSLSVAYRENIYQLDLPQLQQDWLRAESMSWPFSWFSKRKLRETVKVLAIGDEIADVAHDIPLLLELRVLRDEAVSVDFGLATDGLWRGLKTDADLLTCAVAFQGVLADASCDRPWNDDGFYPIADGRCGARLAEDLATLRRLVNVNELIIRLGDLSEATSGNWAAQSTQVECLEAALRFQSALSQLRDSGALSGDHVLVEGGDCGAVLASDSIRLQKRAGVERDLAALDDLRESTSGVWNGLKSKLDEIDGACNFHRQISDALSKISTTPDAFMAANAALAGLLGEDNALLAPEGTVGKVANSYLHAVRSLDESTEGLFEAGRFSDAARTRFADLKLDQMRAVVRAMLDAEGRLRGWCAWRSAEAQALTEGLVALVTAIESEIIQPSAVRIAFETNYSRWWLNAVVGEEDAVRTFVSVEHEKRIANFRALDEQFTALTRSYIRASLCGKLPEQSSVMKSSEWGVLRHEMAKKRRHLPLRELIGRIPTALQKLAPCLLMSPLSIAQYLATGASTFDVVVFDEASQIPVWDAVGAISRGKQVVMVGDPKQLPPTSFFERAEADDDDETFESDHESILDECLGANLPTMNLNWHYRSRNESLITFSNQRYYGNSLVTFPSPATEDSAVTFHHVQGVYEKGGARINKPEARALVADLVGRLKSPGFREANQTIGVVTLNAEQQNLIENLLDDERRKDPDIEVFFADSEVEPVFVKNLESVQGDERDIMYFSITYGPDLSGAVSMNFGPMNRTGGERRLNVAITRARHELRVFSSLKAEQMNLARSQAIGVRDLKHFLDFAERGTRALVETTSGSRGDFESPFEECVAAALARAGWELHTQVGASSFRVDLAVVHPDARGTYLTGIECDGATYHRSATARDRDKLREQVLRGLGWEILRVWSTDWWIDSKGTFAKLDSELRALLEAGRRKRAALPVAPHAKLETLAQ